MHGPEVRLDLEEEEVHGREVRLDLEEEVHGPKQTLASPLGPPHPQILLHLEDGLVPHLGQDQVLDPLSLLVLSKNW